MLFVLNVVQLNYAMYLESSQCVWARNRLTSSVLLWLHILVVVGLDPGKPLLDTTIDVSPSLPHIPQHCGRQLQLEAGWHVRAYGAGTDRDPHPHPQRFSSRGGRGHVDREVQRCLQG